MSFLGKLVSNALQRVNPELNLPLFTPATGGKNLAENPANDQQNDLVLKTLAKNVTADVPDADNQTDSRCIFKQEIEQVDKQKLSKTADKTVRVVFSKPAEKMDYDDYTRDYLRAMLREAGVSKATDAEINNFQSLLKDATGGDGFGVEDKVEQARMTERYRAAQTAKGGGEAYWETSPQARAQVLAGAGAILRERAAAGAQLGAAQAIGQQKATEMALDIPKVFVRAAINTAEGVSNMAIEVADPSIKTDPHNWTRAKVGDWATTQLPPSVDGKRETVLPRVDAEPIRPEYKSDVMNRDVLTGKVNKDGLTVGKLTETGVELVTPVVAGKVAMIAKAPQTLRSAGALPETVPTAAASKTTAAAEVKAVEVGSKAATTPTEEASRVYRVQGGTPPKESKFRIFIGEKGEMVVKGEDRLFVTFDDIGRVKVYQAKNRPGSEVISFEVDPKLVEDIRKVAVAQDKGKQFPNLPQIADETKTSGSFGLSEEWIEKLKAAAKPGTGRIEK